MAARKLAAPQYDVTVVGGGIVGLTLSALLGRAMLKVAIIESSDPGLVRLDGEYDLRTFAMTQASARIFQNIGAWDFVQRQRHGSFRRMEVWDENSAGHICFDSARLAEPALGYIVEQRLLRMALEQVLLTMPNVSMCRSVALHGWLEGKDRLVVTFSDGRRFDTQLLVGADGADSCVRSVADIRHARSEYEQEAIVCNVHTELAHADTARQRFLGTGPLAFLPLDNPQMSSVVWSTSPLEATRLLSLPTAEFCEELSAAFEYRLGRVLDSGPRSAYPLSKAHAERYVQSRIALVGDAAHIIHPLAGQGANMGMLDAAALAQVVVEAKVDERDIGALRVLRRYERWRKGENNLMNAAMDGFKYLFGSKRIGLRWLRGVGLNLTDRSELIKEVIMRRAMGLSGDLPVAARTSVAGLFSSIVQPVPASRI